MQLKKSGPNWQIEKVLYSIMTMPHTSLVTRQKLLELGWDVLSHPPYSPDLAPSDYFLFRSLQNSLNGKNFNNDDDIKSYLIQLFANKNHKFYERGITMLPERWQKVIDQNDIRSKWTTQNKVLKKIRNYLVANPIYYFGLKRRINIYVSVARWEVAIKPLGSEHPSRWNLGYIHHLSAVSISNRFNRPKTYRSPAEMP